MAIKAGSSKLVVLAEQTAFLLHQQQEMKAFYAKEYAEFTAVLHQKIEEAEKSGNKQELEDLLFIRNVIQEQAEQLSREMTQDISFLQGQLDGITQVQELNDPEREQEFERMLLEDGHELLPTPDFEREVLVEATSSKKSMSAMLNDFKNTLEEGGGTTLARLLEAMIDQSQEGSSSKEDLSGVAPGRHSGSDGGSAKTEAPGHERAEYDMNDLEDTHQDLSKVVNEACCGKNDTSAGEKCCSEEDVDIFALLKQAALNNDDESEKVEEMKDIKGCCLQEGQEKKEEPTRSGCECKPPSNSCQCQSSCSSSSSSCCKNRCERKSECKADNGPSCKSERSCKCKC